MRDRGKKFLKWNSSKMETSKHCEIGFGGIQIDVEVHVAPPGMTLVFVGVYARDGSMIYEELYGNDIHTRAEALAWAINLAKSQAAKHLN